MSAMVQFRALGGALGLAIVTTALTTSVRSKLSPHFTEQEIDRLLKTSRAFADLPISRLILARNAFAEGYNLQMRIATGLSAAQIPSAMLLWRKKQINLPS